MSYSELVGIGPKGKISTLLELPNSHGSAPVIWEAIGGKYLGLTQSYGGPGGGWMENVSKICDLWKNTSIPESIRAVLLMTFDREYIEKKDYLRAASDIRQFMKEFSPKPGYVNHWATIADFLEKKPKAAMIGIYHTSVSENPYEGEYNEKTGKHAPMKLKDYFSIYRSLEDLREKSVAS